MDSPGIRELASVEIPLNLRALTPPCRRLFVRGALPLDSRPRVAMVGSRRASASGWSTAYAMARDLSQAGVVVVSGLALGIDAAAHRGALDGGGTTVAFLGAGPDVLYPAGNRALAEEIADRGALISEYAPGTPPLPFRFVERNRLVAAYTQGTVIVECGRESGALITAGMAVSTGRELWVVPGDPRRPSCAGSNRLLRDGAAAVLDAADVMAALGLAAVGAQIALPLDPPPGLSAAQEKLWRCLAREGPGDAESLSRRSRLPAASLLEALALLELSGHVRRDGEGYALALRG